MPLLPILCYHHVGVSRDVGGHRRLWVSRERFGAQMAYLRQAGYRCLTLRDAWAYLRDGREAPPRTVVLTFDDGYRDFYQEAYPILSQYGFPATVFVVVQAVGGVSRWDEGPEAPLMSWQEIRELYREGMELGSHSMSHPRLTRIPLGAAKQELQKSRQLLEEQLAGAVESFAYPYGDCGPALEELVEETGYRLACSMVRGNLHTSHDLFRLKRVPVDEFTSLARFRRRLLPLYDYTCRLRRWWQRVRRSQGKQRDGG